MPQTWRAAWFLAIFILAGPAVLAQRADSVTLRNGDVLTGQIQELTDDHVTLEHPVLGRLVIPRVQVSEISHAAMNLDQVDADLDQGSNTSREQEQEADGEESDTDHPMEGVAMPATREPTTQPAVAANATQPTKKIPDEPRPKSWFDGWKTKLVLRFDGRDRDNSGRDELTGRVGYEADRKTHEDRWKFDGSLRFDDYQDTGSRLRYDLGGLHDQYYVGTPWSMQVRSRFEYDQGKEWDYRASGDTSLGYDVIDTKTFLATVRGGFGFVQEIGAEAVPFRPEGLVGGELTWKITPTQELTGRADFFPDLTEVTSYRVVSSLVWQIKVKQTDRMSFRLGAENEYESNPRGDGSRNTLHYFGAVVFEF